MANAEFVNYQLYRTTPKLSGNLMWDIIIEPDPTDQSKLIVVDFHLRPISERVPYTPMSDEDILTRPHQFNIKKFAESTKGNFYSCAIDPALASDSPILIPSNDKDEDYRYYKTWDDTYWAGTRRISHNLYSVDNKQYTHQTLIPMWLESLQDITISLNIKQSSSAIGAPKQLILKKPDVRYHRQYSYHERFCQYFFDYLKYVGIHGTAFEGNNNCISINFKEFLCTLSGLDINSGNMQIRHDYNIVRNLTYRERPLLESNSLLTNAFRDVNMILPQLINFNLIYNPKRILKGIVSSNPSGKNFVVSTSIKASYGKYSELQQLPKFDLFTNHEFIRRPQVEIRQASKETTPEKIWYDIPGVNALDYLQDYKVSDIMHTNKMVQPICHWQVVYNGTDQLFNLYDGFGMCTVGGDGKISYVNHTYGGDQDTSITTYDRANPNDNWTGMMQIGNGNNIAQILASDKSVQDYIDSGYLQSMSGYINNNKFSYSPDTPDAPDDVYIGLMKTEKHSETGSMFPAETWVDSNSKHIAIWVNRYDTGGDTLMQWGSKWADLDSIDVRNDVMEYHDMDNRFAKYYNRPESQDHFINWYKSIGGEELPTDIDGIATPCSAGVDNPQNHRRDSNSYGLVLAFRRAIITDKNGDPRNVLAVIAWTQTTTKQEIGTSTTHGQILAQQDPQALVLGYLINAVQKYYSTYYSLLKNTDNEYYDWVDEEDRVLMDDVEAFVKALGTLDNSIVIYFDRTLSSKHDIALDKRAQEIEYYKEEPCVDRYVYRRSENIKPAMFQPSRARSREMPNKALRFGNAMGRNFFYSKDILRITDVPTFATDYNKYAISNISAKYPSMDYDSVKPLHVPHYTISAGDAKEFISQAKKYPRFAGFINYYDLIHGFSLDMDAFGNDASVLHSEMYFCYDYSGGCRFVRIKDGKFTTIVPRKYGSEGPRTKKYFAIINETSDNGGTTILDAPGDTSMRAQSTTPASSGLHSTATAISIRDKVIIPDLNILRAPLMIYEFNFGADKVFKRDQYGEIIPRYSNLMTVNRYTNIYGDLMYNEPLAIFNGRTMANCHPIVSHKRFHVWPEYKWFDHSKITILPTFSDDDPEAFTMQTVRVWDNTEEAINEQVLLLLISNLYGENISSDNELDLVYLKSIYDITYELINIDRTTPWDAINIVNKLTGDKKLDEESYENYSEKIAPEYLDENNKVILYNYQVKLKLK